MEILKSIFDFDKPINFIAFVIILSLMILAIVGTYSAKHPRLKKYAKQSPAILATVGIFFSFYGITNGLIALDLRPEFIKDSIPNLLDGLKVKFISSLMGIGASIIVRVVQNFAVEEEIADINLDEKIVGLLGDIHKVLANSANSSPEALLQELKEEIGKLPIEFGKQTILLESIKTSLVGDNEGSLGTKLDKVRLGILDSFDKMEINNKQRSESLNSTLTTKFDDLTQEFKNFAEESAKNNTEVFIKALSEAMENFNDSLAKHIGKNFERLNGAIEQLLDWQEKYKEHVEQMTYKFDVALQSVEKIQIAFGDIQTRSESFAGVSTELSGILQKLNSQLQEFDAYLKGISLIANNAKDAFPIIQKNIIDLTSGFKKSTEQSLADITSTVETVGENLVETTSRLKDTTGKLRDSMENQCETLEKTSTEFKTVVNQTLNDLSDKTQASIQDYQSSLQQVVTKQLDSIDANIQKSNEIVNSTIQNASDTFEKSISETGAVLKTSTDTVANHLTNATDAMKGMIENQQSALNSTSTEFKTVVNQTLNDLSDKTQASIQNYQESLQEAVTKQLDSIDANIQKSNEIVNSTIQNASAEFENAIKAQSESMNRTIFTASDSFKTAIQDTAKDFEVMAESIAASIDVQEKTLTNVSHDVKVAIDKTLHDLTAQSKASIKEYENNLHIVITDSSREFRNLLTDNMNQNGEV